jgi:hypothetical protein
MERADALTVRRISTTSRPKVDPFHPNRLTTRQLIKGKPFILHQSNSNQR